MSKVKITQEQADWIERYTLTQEQADHLINIHTHRKRPDSPLVDWSTSKLARALYIGYEVEPEFKVGDWVTNKNTMRAIEVNSPKVDFLNKGYSHGQHFRHATPEEIAKEKQRRWWKSHNRDVWEIREDDILEYLNDLYIVDSFDSEKVYLKSGIERKTDYAEPFDFVKKHFKVVAFSDDRKDV